MPIITKQGTFSHSGEAVTVHEEFEYKTVRTLNGVSQVKGLSTFWIDNRHIGQRENLNKDPKVALTFHGVISGMRVALNE